LESGFEALILYTIHTVSDRSHGSKAVSGGGFSWGSFLLCQFFFETEVG
jgi:hypothetical protein